MPGEANGLIWLAEHLYEPGIWRDKVFSYVILNDHGVILCVWSYTRWPAEEDALGMSSQGYADQEEWSTVLCSVNLAIC